MCDKVSIYKWLLQYAVVFCIITIEDNAELKLTSVSNLVRLEARNRNTEGTGEITIRDLIRTSLRMRPDRIIVGEVRSAEAFDMLQAMNTGHAGSLSTGHGNSPSDMLSRLETMVLMGNGRGFIDRTDVFVSHGVDRIFIKSNIFEYESRHRTEKHMYENYIRDVSCFGFRGAAFITVCRFGII